MRALGAVVGAHGDAVVVGGGEHARRRRRSPSTLGRGLDRDRSADGAARSASACAAGARGPGSRPRACSGPAIGSCVVERRGHGPGEPRRCASRSTPPGWSTMTRRTPPACSRSYELEAEVGEQGLDERRAHARSTTAHVRCTSSGRRSSQTKGVGRSPRLLDDRTNRAAKYSGVEPMARSRRTPREVAATLHWRRRDASTPAARRRRSVGPGDDGDEVGLVVGRRAREPSGRCRQRTVTR